MSTTTSNNNGNDNHDDFGKPSLTNSADFADVPLILNVGGPEVPVQSVGVKIAATAVSSLSDNVLGHRCVLEQDVHCPQKSSAPLLCC